MERLAEVDATKERGEQEGHEDLKGAPGGLIGNRRVKDEQQERVDCREKEGAVGRAGRAPKRVGAAGRAGRAPERVGAVGRAGRAPERNGKYAESEAEADVVGKRQVAGEEPLEILPPGMDVPVCAR